MYRFQSKWSRTFKFISCCLSLLMFYQASIPLAYAINAFENLSIRAKIGKTQLSWNGQEGVERFEIFRSLQLAGVYEKIADTEGSVNVYVDDTVENGILHYYQVRSVPADGGEPCASVFIAALPPETRTRMARVPDVFEQSRIDAENLLASANLTLGFISLQDSVTIPIGDVVSQDPPPNSTVPDGFAVNLILSSGAPANTPPEVNITRPSDNSTFDEGTSITFEGTANDAEEGDLTSEISWDSDIDGALGNGGSVASVLSVGTHTITASAIDSGGLPGNASIQVTINAASVAVPDVVGQSQSDAEAAIVVAGLVVGTVTTMDSDTVPAGEVISQDPVGGTLVTPESAVDLVVSAGPAPIAIPDVVGQAQTDAEAVITGAGLVVGTVTTANSDTVPAGDVISQDPVGGTLVVPGSSVDIVISDGPAPIPVPDVVGQAQADAEAAIVSAGLTVGTVTMADSDTVPAGDVVSQNPVGGTLVPPGTGVELVVSTGPATVAVPDVVGQVQADAEAAILGAGLVVGTITTTDSDTVPSGEVISQNPVGGTLVATGSPVDLVVSAGPAPVAVPDVVGQAQADAEAAIGTAGLIVGAVTTANSDTLPAGSVISQIPVGGTLVALGSVVDLVVSNGPAPVTVPDVVGQAQADAEATIIGAGLAVGTVTNANSDTVPAGDVISQDPVGGTQVAPGSAVDLVISDGPTPIAVPDVTGQAQANAEAAIVGAGLTVGAVTTANNDTVPAGDVISQDPVGGILVPPGSAVDLVISDGPAVIADLTRPEVDVVVVPANANVGDTITVTVNATDNVGVTSRELVIDGNSIALDASGTATFSSPTAGVFVAEGTAVDAAGNEGFDSEEIRFLVPGDTTPPTVAISAPADNAVLTEPTDIVGTVTDDTNLTQYKLEYSLKGKNEFITFAAGTSPVTDDVLGKLDASMLRNGLYEVRLTAEDASGNIASITRTYQLDGELKVGNFTISFNDLTIPVAGIPITITRTYDSRIKTKGDFGVGWKLSVSDIEVSESGTLGEGWQQTVTGFLFLFTYHLQATEPHFVNVTLPDGRTHEFNMIISPTSNPIFPFGLLAGTTASFVPATGTFSSLTSLDNNSLSVIPGAVGPVELFEDFLFGTDIYDPDRYLFTDVDGTEYVINQNSGLESITEPNGNTISFTANGIIHSAGRSVTFTRDAQGRITTITDPMGNTIQYSYDFYGDLVSTTDQEANTTSYTYNSSHGLLDIIDPRGVTPSRNEYDNEGQLIATIDAEGNRTEFTHDTNANQEVIRDRKGNVTVHSYDNNGNITSSTDALGNTTTSTYDSQGNKLTETDPLGNTKISSYDSKGNVTSDTDPLGNTTSYAYDARNNPLTITDPLGNTISNSYDSSGNVLASTDALGNTVNHTYDNAGNPLTTTDANGNVTARSYNGSGDITQVIDANGSVTNFIYDINGNQLSESKTRTDSQGNTVTLTTSKTYDNRNRVIQEIDPLGNASFTEYNLIGQESAVVDKNGNRTEVFYDLRGNRIKTIYPDGTEENATYDKEGNRTTIIDRGGRTTTFQYDALNRLINTTYPDSSNISRVYDAAGRLIQTSDENGNTTSFEYDAAGRQTKIIDMLSNETLKTYDAVGRQVTSTDANMNTTTYVYDQLGRRIRTVFPDGTNMQMTYNNFGRKISETDQEGNVTLFDYDSIGQLLKVTDALGNETTFTYDEVGNKTAQTDANGNTTQWTYDNLGQVASRTLPEGMIESFAYDANGNRISHTDFNGDTTNFVYDANNRLIQKTFSDGSQVTNTYTPTGQLATVTDSRGVTAHSYDQRDRLIQVTNPDGTTISYTYDAVGNRTSVTVPSGTATYTYDVLNRLSTVTDPAGGVATYSYDAVGNRAAVTLPNGTATQYTYDSLNRLTLLENERSDGSIISSYNYTLGLAGNRTQVAENSGRIVTYTYDATFKLLEEDISDPVLGNETLIYSYDPVGNRLSKTDASGVITYTYDNNDRLLSENSTTYAYDNNGNTLSRSDGANITVYTYNPENRLTTAQTPTSFIAYKYDADGIRASSTVNGVRTDYLVDKNRDFAQVLEEVDGSSNLLVSYVYGDDLLSQNRGLPSYYHYDGLGSTRALTDNSEFVTDTYVYEAFGELIDATGGTVNDYLFTGEQFDPNIGFYYLRARYYNPEIVRFVTLDTFQGNIFDPISLHKYLYANADPVNNIDPSGETSIAVGISITLPAITLPAISLISVLKILALLGVVVLVAAIVFSRPIRLNHYTKYQFLPLIFATGINSPSGKNFFTPDWYLFSSSAKSSLALPSTPEVGINLTLFLNGDGLIGPSVVAPMFGEPGGGIELVTFQPVHLIPFRFPIPFPLF